MKKLSIIGMILILSLSLAGCGGSKSSNNSTPSEIQLSQESKAAINSSLDSISANFAFQAFVIAERCAASIIINGAAAGTKVDIIANLEQINTEFHSGFGVPTFLTEGYFKREITIENVAIHAYSNGEFVANGTFTIVDTRIQEGDWGEVYRVTKNISVKFVKKGLSYVIIEFNLS